MLNEDKNENSKGICVLFSSLDACKISEASFKESMSMKDEHYGFVPKYNISFINSFNQAINESQALILKQFENCIQKVIDQQNQSFELFKSEIEQRFTSKIDDLNKKIDKLTKQNDEANKKLDQIVHQNSTLNSLSAKINDDTKKICHQNPKIITNLQNISNQQNQSFIEIKNNFSSIINSITKQNSNVNNTFYINNGEIIDNLFTDDIIVNLFLELVKSISEKCKEDISPRFSFEISNFDSIKDFIPFHKSYHKKYLYHILKLPFVNTNDDLNKFVVELAETLHYLVESGFSE